MSIVDIDNDIRWYFCGLGSGLMRRSAMSAMGNSGATNTEIVSFSGHSITSPVVGTYVRPDKTTARNAANKRWEKKTIKATLEKVHI
jgi:hypothetical protein